MDEFKYLDERYFTPDYEPDEDDFKGETVIKPKRNSRQKRPCQLCGLETAMLGRHISSQHLPWWHHPFTACWGCKVQEGSKSFLRSKHKTTRCLQFGEVQRNQWFSWIHQFLELIQGKLEIDTLAQLKDYVLKQGLYNPNPYPPGFNQDEQDLLKDLAQLYGWEIPETFSAKPPNSIASLIHWDILMKLIHQTPMTAWTGIAKFAPEMRVKIIDSHGHLDMLMVRQKTSSLRELEDKADTGNYQLSGIVANFVYPSQWQAYSSLVDDARIKYSFGVHPRLVKHEHQIRHYIKNLEELLEQPRCVAVGEVGLEFTHTSHAEQRAQCIFLERVFDLLRQTVYKEKILILHCRDNGSGKAAQKVFTMIKNMGLQERKIHRHCFTGSVEELIEWTENFPNCYFGLTKTIFRSSPTQDSVKSMPLTRMLLESDCPYLSATPWLIGPVIHRISELINIPANTLIQKTNENTVNLYGEFQTKAATACTVTQ